MEISCHHYTKVGDLQAITAMTLLDTFAKLGSIQPMLFWTCELWTATNALSLAQKLASANAMMQQTTAAFQAHVIVSGLDQNI
jgi:hypothetical protein